MKRFSDIQKIFTEMSFHSPYSMKAIPTPDFSGMDDDEDLHRNNYPNLKLITADEFEGILTGNLSNDYLKILPLDCRYDYEYKAGHISGAKNITDMESLLSIFSRYKNSKNVCVVFYCEFSTVRGPKFMTRFIEFDSLLNSPNETRFFQNVFLLKGGFSNFYELKKNNQAVCAGNYVKMLDEHHVRNGDYKKCNDKFREFLTIRLSCYSQIGRSFSQPITYNSTLIPNQYRKLCKLCILTDKPKFGQSQ
ncbi:Rhodanese-like domain containing protein [Tritrichomonas foetus]|uniref:protein-tyrosine-phosphatase n=1 Tax=Tritrichomonas foetus TaxID=1144522 RepID=A0A1J4J722_9EUKA|nr:Rhodanese-like domain containing protein [Tritrichomonas foetus]|eukprot:OHS93999.1 Rhodanese-like domain containing protein [Tritrichomonas foetus]